MTSQKFVTIYLLAIIFLNLSCKEKPTEQTKEDFKPSKRDYTWTVDTLFYVLGGQVLLQSIWGSSPSNVYAVGHDAHGGIATMWHYDGKKWATVKLIPPYGGNIPGPFDLKAIYGFDSTNIYAVGSRIYQTFSTKPPYFLDSSFIIHFDGKVWNEINIKRSKGELTKINASSSLNIWCSGNPDYIYNFNGIEWKLDSIPFYNKDSIAYTMNNSAILISSTGNPITISQIHNNNNGSFEYKFYKKNNSHWQAIDSFTNIDVPKWGINTLGKDNDGNIYSGGDAIYQLRGDSWSQLFHPQYPIVKLWGTSKTNIFALSILGFVYHFNGIDWAELAIPSNKNIDFHGVWGTNDEIFLSASDGNKTYMFHGK
jgi:hypothetical protein